MKILVRVKGKSSKKVQEDLERLIRIYANITGVEINTYTFPAQSRVARLEAAEGLLQRPHGGDEIL